MDFRIFIEPQQGADYDSVLGLARATGDHGLDGFFTSDHYLRMGDTDGLPGPLDAWTTLAGLARDTERIRLGSLVSPATFRHPGAFAIQVAQVDDMSGGRVELGLGAGWYQAEHGATGIPFPSLGERFDRLEETATVLTEMWATPPGELYNHSGDRFSIVDSPALPKPRQQPGPPIIIGGGGRERTPRLAARVASEFNLPFTGVDDWAAAVGHVQEVCRQHGRDPGELVYSAAQVVCVGRDEDELARRAAAIGRQADELRENGIAGLPDEAAAKIATFADAGCQRMYLQYLDIDDVEMLDLLASEVLGG